MRAHHVIQVFNIELLMLMDFLEVPNLASIELLVLLILEEYYVSEEASPDGFLVVQEVLEGDDVAKVFCPH